MQFIFYNYKNINFNLNFKQVLFKKNLKSNEKKEFQTLFENLFNLNKNVKITNVVCKQSSNKF